MRNRITSGQFAGRRLVLRRGDVWVQLRGQLYPLNRSNVNAIRVLSVSERMDLLSGLLRGWLFGWIFWAFHLPAVLSAKTRCTYLLRVTYRNGAVSVVEVDHTLFCALCAILPVV